MLRGLYAITDPALLPTEQLLLGVTQAIAGGARLIQYRNKQASAQQQFTEAQALLSVCRQHGVLLIINDDVELATTIAADGVHLGKDDAEIAHARQRLGGGIIGVSCYNDWRRAETAAAAGADYIAFGAFFSSPTKPAAATASPELLTRARQRLAIPVVAIGGITADNGGELINAGADMLAVISGVFGQKDIRHAAENFSALFATATSELN